MLPEIPPFSSGMATPVADDSSQQAIGKSLFFNFQAEQKKLKHLPKINDKSIDINENEDGKSD